MAEKALFDSLCEALEELTSLDRLEARGTVRLSLKQAGLEPRGVTASQMAVMAQKVLPTELASRGIEHADRVCEQLVEGLGKVETAPAVESPESVFERLGS